MNSNQKGKKGELELGAKTVNIEDHNTLVQIDIALLSENVK